MNKEWFAKLKQGTESLNYGRDIIVSFTLDWIKSRHNTTQLNILDIGLGNGFDLLNVKQSIPKDIVLSMYGIDSLAQHIEIGNLQGISAHLANIETEQLPFDSNFFDIVIANQVIEHTKEIFWIFSEISRVLKVGGVAIIGVPNLASLHNRILLLLGEQPSSIELLGPHVRGITKNSFLRFVTADDYFKVLDVKGANFYPFPSKISKVLSNLFPTLAVSLFFLCEKTDKPGNFIDVLQTRFYETEYFQGRNN